MPGSEYQIIREIGRGSFGIVFEGIHSSSGTPVALKRFHVQSLGGNDLSDLRARFRREVKYQSAIQHENVVRIFESETDTDEPWFSMELAICSLADELIKDRTL
jgi:serine/threonine protein kinase